LANKDCNNSACSDANVTGAGD